ncbi:hypothetical protein ACTIVE_4922 [Actinomadura verrucosospora]|uniref:Uncharacterized protein n=1 Tax=Actinomadura verrucosospora TaxID=46165 RepID=A0A7D3VUJ2_ACTVE|nr:hypothetical protein ACTIVE_4922 [Actinomadura verrucosospora]
MRPRHPERDRPGSGRVRQAVERRDDPRADQVTGGPAYDLHPRIDRPSPGSAPREVRQAGRKRTRLHGPKGWTAAAQWLRQGHPLAVRRRGARRCEPALPVTFNTPATPSPPTWASRSGTSWRAWAMTTSGLPCAIGTSPTGSLPRAWKRFFGSTGGRTTVRRARSSRRRNRPLIARQ